MKNRKLIVMSGPSGVGKATIEKKLFSNELLKLKLSCSATTRKPREGEIDGIHYHFISREEFEKKQKQNEFLEWNEHFSNKYGTLKSEIDRIIINDLNPFVEVEPIGALNIFKKYDPSEIISIFIMPPSIDELKYRIEKRKTETQKQINERMKRVEKEIEMSSHFQHRVINDDVNEAADKIAEIIMKELK